MINPAIDIVKGGPNSEVGAGSEIVWTFSIKNIGDAPLINVIFDDPLLAVSKTYTDNGGVLAVGAYWNFTLKSIAPNGARNCDERGHRHRFSPNVAM